MQGISLALDQYNAFLKALPLIEEALKKKGDRVVRPNYDAEPHTSPEGGDANVESPEEDAKGDDGDSEE